MNITPPLLMFEPHTFKDKILTLQQSRHIRLFENIEPCVLIIIYNHYMSKFLELKNQVLKLRFKIQLIIQYYVVEMVKVLRYIKILFPNLMV